ncbi:MAG: hypothetical protein J5720_00570 [Bacteroidaceae bacterium]|nr:hypothetical protein [Bacteroidaceae bacterium]
MNYNNPLPQSINNIIRLTTIVLFALFSFIYLFCIQNDVLAEAQYVFSSGLTSYSRFWGALIITVFLVVIQFYVAKASKLVGRWYALTFFPSFLVLAFLTSLNRAVIEDFTFGQWIWALPLLIVLFILLLYIKRRLPGESINEGDYHLSRYLWPNYAILFLMMIICGANASADDVYMYELKAERLLLEDDFEGASRVGEKSLNTSPRLNEMRMYALARQGLLGEKLFDYPQPYAEQSLMMMEDTVTRLHRFTCKDIQKSLGAWANTSVTTFDHYISLLKKNPSTRYNPLLADYLLCGKLLQKDLRGFTQTIKHYYNLSSPADVQDLPKAYREALLLQAKAIGQDSLNAFVDTLMLTEYKDYCAILESDDSELIRKNKLRRSYGNTLWWYLDN